MRAVSAALEQNQEALILVPEIALISQMERIFRARFGECVALLHSGLSQGERFDQWMRILRKEAKVAIGARSAVFAPFENLGLIVVDEEHDDSYKQESKLRYHARDLAVLRAKQQGAMALLGSATPSVGSCYNADAGKFRKLNLPKRIEDRLLPEVMIVDLKEPEGSRRARPIITKKLEESIAETLRREEQILLFLNRRGFANYPVCVRCGAPVFCKNCDITMTLHQAANAYRCHYCGYTRAQTAGCDVCGGSKMKLLGLGTEKVETRIQELFPQARVARMDRDTTARKGALVKILKDLRTGAIDILIGTQMVAKGHDYPNITLVGIICADLSLSFPDFRAGERTFQLLAQVAGRAGRGEQPGRVILQTYNPDHFCILTARDQDYKAFYDHEIRFRRSLKYPPFSRLIHILIAGKDKDQTARYARNVGEICQELQSHNQTYRDNVERLGPVAAPLARLQKQYRWHILLKGLKPGPLHGLSRALMEKAGRISSRTGVKMIVDVDPIDML
jgi:primosomal protein N' (replication factor Y)